MLLKDRNECFETTKYLLANWSNWLKHIIEKYALFVENNIFNFNNLQLNHHNPVSSTLDLVKENILNSIFNSISNKFKLKIIYSKEDLFLYFKTIFERYINWINTNEKDNASIWIYFLLEWNVWVIDYISKDDSWRKMFYTTENFSNRLWLSWDFFQKTFIKLDNWEIFNINEKDGLIVIKSQYDSGYYIVHLKSLNEFEKKVLNYLLADLTQLIRDKIWLILARYINPLTWCKNKTYFDEHSTETEYSVIAIDISDFKTFNDKYWYQNWNAVLRKVWKVLRSCVRKNEWEVVHLSWDEFCIIVKRGKDWTYREIIDNILSRLDYNKSKNNFKIALDIEWNSKEIDIKYSYWISENSTEWWKLTLRECYKKADSRLMLNKWSRWMLNRIRSFFDSYPVEKQKNVFIELSDIFNKLSSWLKIDILLSIAKKFNIEIDIKNKE